MVTSILSDTICAIATPIGEGGIGIVKISGPDALSIAARLFRSHRANRGIVPFRLHHGWILDPSSDEPVDEVLLAAMPAPRTYTGEDVAEINCHSGFAILDRILGLVIAQGARIAEPGEFTRRAFLNGRLDLTQAEAIIDVIRARSAQSLDLAARQLSGGLRGVVEQLHGRLVAIEAEMEAAIDFAEEMDDESHDFQGLAERIELEIIRPIEEWVRRSDEGRVLREGVKLVLVGKPNVGKSSILNGLLGRDRAIVTPVAGTTRDVVEDTFVLSGVLTRILDTAGLRGQPDLIEAMGMERTLSSIEDADLALWVVDRGGALTEEDDAAHRALEGRPHLIVLNKADLPPVTDAENVRSRFHDPSPAITISALAPTDIERLKAQLADLVLRKPVESLGSAIIPNRRHRIHFLAAADYLHRARDGLIQGRSPELTAMEVRGARMELNAILGLDGSEEILDRVFSQFCIGK